MANESKVTELSAAAPEKASAIAKHAVVSATIKGSTHLDGMSGNKKVIEIYSSDQEGGNFAVLVGHNGVMYQIPRGVRVEVAEEVAQILRDAIQTVTTPNPSGGVTTREVPRYNFQVHN